MGSYLRTYPVDAVPYELYMHVEDEAVGYQLVAFDGTVLIEELAAEPSEARAAALIRQLRDEL